MPRSRRLLPAPLDRLAGAVAPPWRPGALSSGGLAGSGARLLRPALWLLVAAAAVQSLLHLVDLAVFDLRLDRINADKDASVAGWLGTVTTWSTALGALLLALLARAVRAPMLALAGLCGFLSLDDMVVLHEIVANVAQRFDAYGHDGYTFWPLVYFPLMCVVGWLLLRTARSVDVGTGRFLVAGLACLVSAVALEATAPVLYALGSDHGQPLYELEVTVEEALETLGWGAIALGLLSVTVDLLLARGAVLGAPFDRRGPVTSARPDGQRRGDRVTAP